MPSGLGTVVNGRLYRDHLSVGIIRRGQGALVSVTEWSRGEWAAGGPMAAGKQHLAVQLAAVQRLGSIPMGAGLTNLPVAPLPGATCSRVKAGRREDKGFLSQGIRPVQVELAGGDPRGQADPPDFSKSFRRPSGQNWVQGPPCRGTCSRVEAICREATAKLPQGTSLPEQSWL